MSLVLTHGEPQRFRHEQQSRFLLLVCLGLAWRIAFPWQKIINRIGALPAFAVIDVRVEDSQHCNSAVLASFVFFRNRMERFPFFPS